MTEATAEITREQLAGDFAKAAEILRHGGLYQGSFRPIGAGCDGPRCTTAALIEAHIGYVPRRFGPFMRDIQPHVDRLAEVLGEELSPNEPTTFSAVVEWNDRPERKVEDVLAAFEKAREVDR